MQVINFEDFKLLPVAKVLEILGTKISKMNFSGDISEYEENMRFDELHITFGKEYKVTNVEGYNGIWEAQQFDELSPSSQVVVSAQWAGWMLYENVIDNDEREKECAEILGVDLDGIMKVLQEWEPEYPVVPEGIDPKQFPELFDAIHAVAKYVHSGNISNAKDLREGGEDPGEGYGKNVETVEAYINQNGFADSVVEVLNTYPEV
jgi:hypothetical protein